MAKRKPTGKKNALVYNIRDKGGMGFMLFELGKGEPPRWVLRKYATKYTLAEATQVIKIVTEVEKVKVT